MNEILFEQNFKLRSKYNLEVEIIIRTSKEESDFLATKYILNDLWRYRTEFKEQLEHKLNQISKDDKS